MISKLNCLFCKCVFLTILLPSVKYWKWNRKWHFMTKIIPYWKWNRWTILFLGHWPKKSSVVVELHSSNIEGRFFIGGVLVWSQQFRDLSAEKTVEKRSWPARFSPHFFLSLDHRPSNREWILTLITLERQTIMDWYVASFKPQSWRTKNRCPEQNELFPPLWTSKREKSISKTPFSDSID